MVEGEANSTFDSLGDDYLQIGPEMSAPSRGVAVWAILKEIGADGMRDRISRHCSLARHVFELASADERLQALTRPTLSICCYRYRTPDASKVRLTISMQRSRDDCAWRASTFHYPSGWQVRDSAVFH